MQAFVGDGLGFTPGNFGIDPGANRIHPTGFPVPITSGIHPTGFPVPVTNGVPTGQGQYGGPQLPPAEWRNSNGDFNAGVIAAPAAENPFGIVTSMINHLLGGAGKQFDDPSAWLSNYWLEYE